MQIFLATDRLVLRRFTIADADNLVSLDADPEVMRFITGGIPTSRAEILDEVLPAFLGYYARYEGYGFWAAIEKEPGNSWAGSISGPGPAPLPGRSNSVTGCASQPGARGMPPKARVR
jgi:RimJ/RimL family protein N-acetyltransferase